MRLALTALTSARRHHRQLCCIGATRCCKSGDVLCHYFSTAAASSSSSSSSSTGETASPETLDKQRRYLLDAALTLVPKYSFSESAIAEAAASLGLPRSANLEVSTRDLVAHLLESGHAHVQALHSSRVRDYAANASNAANQSLPPPLTASMTVKALTKARLDFMRPYIGQWPDAMALMAKPTNVPFALTQLHALVDEIWHLAGDKSYDLNYYSKRSLLAGVYVSTEAYMTRDKSPNFEMTWRFLDNRFANVREFGQRARDLRDTASWGAACINGVLKPFVRCYRNQKTQP